MLLGRHTGVSPGAPLLLCFRSPDGDLPIFNQINFLFYVRTKKGVQSNEQQ
jgi:hypothetical protein